MINGLDIYYSRKISGSELKPVSNKKTANGLKPVGNKKTASGLKPISNKGQGCKKRWSRIENTTINLIFINNI